MGVNLDASEKNHKGNLGNALRQMKAKTWHKQDSHNDKPTTQQGTEIKTIQTLTKEKKLQQSS